jgi:hypothetical protein
VILVKIRKIIIPALAVFAWTYATAQEITVTDSTEIPQPVGSIFIGDEEDSTTRQPARFEINLGIEKVQSPEVIAMRSVIYNIHKPLPPNEMPFPIQFQNNIFTGFKPVQPLLQFGF